jgi:homoserine O-acetyltransferase
MPVSGQPRRRFAALPDAKLAYVTFGTLNEAKDNAILIPTWYGSTSKIIEQVYIGAGPALDPDRSSV